MLNITIKQKLIGLVFIVASVFAIFLTVYMYGTTISKEVYAETLRDRVIEDAKTNSRISIFQARQNEKDFLLKKDKTYIDKHALSMIDLYKSLKSMQKNIQSDEGVEAVRRLIDLSHQYQEGFNLMVEAQLILGLNEKSGLLGNLSYTAQNIEDSLNQLNNDKLAVKFLMMRRHEKDYIERGDDKYIGLMAERKGQFGMELSESGIVKKIRRQIRSDLNSYYNDFYALVRGVKAVNLVVEGFREQITATEPAFERVEKVVNELRRDNELYYKEANQRISMLYIIAMITGVVIIFTGIIMLARYITGRLDEAVLVCKTMAEGKYGLNIEQGMNDEIGQLFFSLKCLDEHLKRSRLNSMSSLNPVSMAES